MTSKRLGRWAFWIMFIGFNLGFFRWHIAGLLGMPRRIYTYPADMGWNDRQSDHQRRFVSIRHRRLAVHV